MAQSHRTAWTAVIAWLAIVGAAVAGVFWMFEHERAEELADQRAVDRGMRIACAEGMATRTDPGCEGYR